MTLPALPPLVVAQVVEALPARLAARLDAAVDTARSWPHADDPDAVVIRVDETTLVRVKHGANTADDITCSCLLAPRCLHRAAVVSLASTAAPQADNQVETAATAPDPASHLAHGATARPVTAAENAAAEALWRCAGQLLNRGVAGYGAADQAALLRAAHEARALRLPRAASAAVRVVERVRAHHADDVTFDLPALIDDLRDLMTTAHGLQRGRPLHGISRRDYTATADARLYGLFCEPVVTASGYAGAVTHLIDAGGRRFTIAGIRPGDPIDALRAAGSPAEIGDARPTHHELARGGLIVAGLRATADGRLSSGRDVRAVRAAGAEWTQPPLDELWNVPYAEQRVASAAARARPPEERDPDSDLLFLNGWLSGVSRDGVTFRTADDVEVLLIAAHDTPVLRYVDNLRVLARAAGAAVRVVGRPAGRRRVAALAAAADWLPDRYGSHVDLGVDQLRAADIDTDAPSAIALLSVDATPGPPIHLPERRVQRAVVSGRLAVAGDPADIAFLQRSAMPRAAAYAQALDESVFVQRDAFGRASTGSFDRYGKAWLAAALYVATVAVASDAEP